MNVVEQVVTEGRFRLSEWITARRPPGRRVTARLPVVALEVERLWGAPMIPCTGHRWRTHGWVGADDRVARVRFVIPWPGGILWIMEARD